MRFDSYVIEKPVQLSNDGGDLRGEVARIHVGLRE